MKSYEANDDKVIQEGTLNVDPAETEIILVSSVDVFRHLAGNLPNPDDHVLEIGASTGNTTRTLATTGAQVLAVDNSAELIKQLDAALTNYPNVSVAHIDGRNIPALAKLMPQPSVILIDIGGNARLDNVALQLRLCLACFSTPVNINSEF